MDHIVLFQHGNKDCRRNILASEFPAQQPFAADGPSVQCGNDGLDHNAAQHIPAEGQRHIGHILYTLDVALRIAGIELLGIVLGNTDQRNQLSQEVSRHQVGLRVLHHRKGTGMLQGNPHEMVPAVHNGTDLFHRLSVQPASRIAAQRIPSRR